MTAVAELRRLVPIAHRSKRNTTKGWQQWRLDEADLPEHFPAGPSNVGVLLGEPSGWLVDVDLDHPRAVELADEHLPATDAVFGRAGKPRSHRLYVVTAPVVTKKHRSKSAGMLVELRSTGMQTVFPPSVHESGEAIEWEQDEPQPAEVEPEVLLDAVKALADRVKVELGEKQAPRPRDAHEQHDGGTAALTTATDAEPGDAIEPVVPGERRYDAALCAMLAMGIADHRDGSARLFAAACRCIEHDLDDRQAIRCIRQYAQRRPFPRRWSDAAITRRLRDAERATTRGKALTRDEQNLVPLGQREIESGKLVLSPRRTLPTARAYVRDFHDHPDAATLRTYAGLVMDWQDNRYVAIEDAALKHRLQPWLHDALRYVYNKGTKQMELLPFESNPTTVNQALESIRHHTHLDATVTRRP